MTVASAKPVPSPAPKPGLSLKRLIGQRIEVDGPATIVIENCTHGSCRLRIIAPDSTIITRPDLKK